MGESPSEKAERKVADARSVYEDHGRIFRWMWVAVGFVLVAAGLAMIVFPGPATIVIPLGLAMLAVVFGWARQLLVRSLEAGDDAAARIRDASRPVQALTLAASASIAVGITAWILL